MTESPNHILKPNKGKIILFISLLIVGAIATYFWLQSKNSYQFFSAASTTIGYHLANVPGILVAILFLPFFIYEVMGLPFNSGVGSFILLAILFVITFGYLYLLSSIIHHLYKKKKRALKIIVIFSLFIVSISIISYYYSLNKQWQQKLEDQVYVQVESVDSTKKITLFSGNSEKDLVLSLERIVNNNEQEIAFVYKSLHGGNEVFDPLDGVLFEVFNQEGELISTSMSTLFFPAKYSGKDEEKLTLKAKWVWPFKEEKNILINWN